MPKKKYLIAQLASLGDCLYATSISRQLKIDEPNCHITWAIMEHLSFILEGNNDIDNIWKIAKSDGPYYDEGWAALKSAAEDKKSRGEFDEIIYSQIVPDNLGRLTSTIRQGIIKSIARPLKVSLRPIVNLSVQEINNVELFASENALTTFANVVLFECAPQSGQVNLNLEIAEYIATQVVKSNPSTAFILSTPFAFQSSNKNIIDGSKLSYRENLYITHFCTLIIGCSSGITWLCTSSEAKALPMIQILSRKSDYYCGVYYDFKESKFDNTTIIELLDVSDSEIISCINNFLNQGINDTFNRFHQEYLPSRHNLKVLLKGMVKMKYKDARINDFLNTFYAENVQLNNSLAIKISDRLVIYYYKIFYKLKSIKQLFIK